ncbi:Pam17p [Sugiyamaella lignohabitans]|uniref:Presequence translocated-associated motor subunit PAM17 n=1 Tax=Sugiyamaella lignohabitans TaxID=796027 RepID=A0A167DS83_9ASCO|nr:Pam17p [Sugiyamaella lignohabitans]ANB13230.1 Pam17p [Sugiyamaella lignohabitans]
MSASILQSSLHQLAKQTVRSSGRNIAARPFLTSNIHRTMFTSPLSSVLRQPRLQPLAMKSSNIIKTSLFHSARTLKNSEKVTEAKTTGPSGASTTSASSEHPLTWNEFLALRIKRRKINVISSVITTFGGILIGWGAVANVEIDPTALIYGFDPIKVLSVALIVSGGLGYLAGPTLGALVFKASIRKQFGAFVKKDVEFLRHIKRNRPDPRSQSYTNPVTDYYGEKIGSLKDYRQWLRDGRVYRKKTETFV